MQWNCKFNNIPQFVPCSSLPISFLHITQMRTNIHSSNDDPHHFIRKLLYDHSLASGTDYSGLHVGEEDRTSFDLPFRFYLR